MTDNKNLLKGRLDGQQRNRLKGLLDMMYRPSELAEEVGFDQNQVYIVYVPLGCPHERDKNNHIWINGLDFFNWYQETYKKRERLEGEIYCISCKTYQVMSNPERMSMENGSVYDLFTCPNCGKNVANIVSRSGDK